MLGGGAITDGTTDAKNASGDGPLQSCMGCYSRDDSTSLIRQLLLSGPVTHSPTSTHSFLSYIIAPPKLWQICGLDGATATTMVAVTLTSSFCAKWISGTPDSRTLLDGWKMGEEFVWHPGSNPGRLRGKQKDRTCWSMSLADIHTYNVTNCVFIIAELSLYVESTLKDRTC
jgi:hypothetical protein